MTIKGVGDTAVLTVTGQTTWQRSTFDGSANTNRDRAVVNTSGRFSTFEACIIGPGQRLVVVPRQIFSDNGNPTILPQQVSALLEWAKFAGAASALFRLGANEDTLTQ